MSRMVASWDHIVKAVELDSHTSDTGLRYLVKLLRQHLNPKLHETMKVKNAAQVKICLYCNIYMSL